jgi:ubiquinone/menaquinone biosynthesis C-methylase UbiE
MNQDLRFEVYKYAVPYVDPTRLIQERVLFNGDETVLDVGCGNASLLVGLRHRRHTGRLIGMDIADVFVAAQANLEKSGLEPVNFHLGDAHDIAIADSTVDVSTALFMLYHCRPVEAIQELMRVTKPGGTIVIATSGKSNKTLHRAFEEVIASELGYQPAPRFSAEFDNEKADVLLPQFFSEIEVVHQESKISLTSDPEDQAARAAYELSLATMRSSMKAASPGVERTMAEWDEVVANTWKFFDAVSGILLKEHIERNYYFCKNPEK